MTTAMMQSELAQGLRMHRMGDLPGAAKVYQAALARDPADADASCLFGMVLQDLGRPEQAVDWIERAVASRPDVPAYYASLGLALQAVGRSAEAADAFAKLLALNPDDASAHVNRGVIVRALGDLEGALVHFQRAVELEPRLAQARTNLGELLLELGRPEEALPHCQAAVVLAPGLVEAHINLGNVLRLNGQPLEARASYYQALQLDPGRAQAAAGMGIALIRLNLRDQGLVWLRRAVDLDPTNIEYLRQLGEVAAAQGLADEVKACCDRILKLDPNHASAHNALGWYAYQEGRRDEARACYLKALRLQPTFANAHFNLGLLHEEMGEPDLAEAYYRTAVRIDPAHATALARLASMLRGDLPAADLEAIRRLENEPSVIPTERIKLLFGIAEVLDGRGAFSEAASWLQHANAVALAQLGQIGNRYDKSAHHRFVTELVGTFTPSVFERLAGSGAETSRPVFIVGMPRAGTTLIEQILASHPEVHGAGEIPLARRSFEEVPEVMQRSGLTLSCIPDISPGQLDELASRHLQRLEAIDGGRATRIINKMPENYFYLGLLALMFPRAIVIHCRRDLRDVALSCWLANFIEVRWAHDFDDIAARIAEYQRLMNHWRDVLPPDFLVHDVDYEAIVDDLEGVSRQLTAVLGLDWHPACLEFYRTRRPVKTASQNQVRRPIYRSSVGRWKLYQDELAELFAKVERQVEIVGGWQAATSIDSCRRSA
jgi:tetratricopeptide (TPR) repeat protein